ncbi:PREDICTED: transcobalamin-1 [Ceratotherium simum simum]|uniref:Transcobalamin-1 n=1 Tax=Ceratotherium simum simum TaxID=73337 RepID=A0ABM0I006_CERSS|nr:PREDICTED: transcobalamin-1 [Ceratotherium simum simum]
MRQSHQLPLVGLLLYSLIPSQLCKICEVHKENYSCLNPLISTMINSKHTRGIQDANVLLSFRLVGIQKQDVEQQLIQHIKDKVARKGSDLTSGQLALIILALGECQNPDKKFIDDYHLVSQLEKKFQEEIENMGAHNGNPLTNYYQLSLDVLALCLFNGSYSIPKVAELFDPENKNYYFGGQFSVDTGAMAVLALTCLEKNVTNGQIKIDSKDLECINNHIKSLVKKILSEKKENGLIGNIFSTGEAMQALFVSSNYYNESEWDCQQTLDTVLKEISHGTFSIPTAAAQIFPALIGKTYLDVNKDSPCSNNFNISTCESVTPTDSPSNISVHYSVKINETYSTNVTVLNGSFFLDVMTEAQKINETIFSFTMVKTSWGPYITSVQGLSANSSKRTYWQLLSEGKPLSQGAGSYLVHDGENLEVRWSKY